MPIALTIAGSDSGGGAGIQADLKTFAALGVYGGSVITSVTAQNTLEVTGIHDLPAEFITLQLDTVMRDLPIDAVKTGMLSNPAIIRAVSERLQTLGVEKLVVDPVMVAKGGAALLRKEAEAELIDRLLPLAYVVTPTWGRLRSWPACRSAMWRRWSKRRAAFMRRGHGMLWSREDISMGHRSMSSSMAEGSNTLKGSGSRPRVCMELAACLPRPLLLSLPRGPR